MKEMKRRRGLFRKDEEGRSGRKDEGKRNKGKARQGNGRQGKAGRKLEGKEEVGWRKGLKAGRPENITFT